ncbi:MAG TPA: chloride channel protein [Acidimicrobiales bacterium]
MLVLSALTGAVVGLGVAAFEWVTAEKLLEAVLDWPLALQGLAPGIGLALAALALRYLGRGASPTTSDAYIENFHQQDRRLDLTKVPARLLASATTLGLGGALGLEGPSMYLGAATGSALQRRFQRLFSPGAAKTLLVAGAAAGVAAIFKAPATGTVFALEVPYQDDTARRMLLPALVSSASSYLVFVAIHDTTPLFPADGTPPFALRELGGALLLGVLCGGLARLFAVLTGAAKRVHGTLAAPWRILLAGGVLAALLLVVDAATGEQLTLGPGYHVIDWLRTSPSLGLVVLVLGLRVAATVVTLAGGGAGGLFIPLVLLGALTGHLVGDVLDERIAVLFPVVGVAAFLGAGYRTPLAAVMFVAESTGRPGFVIPGLLAAATSQLVMGHASVSGYQESGRVGHLERRFRMPLTTAIRADVLTVPPDATVDELVWQHMLLSRQTSACIVDGPTYLGLIRLQDLSELPRDRWSALRVGDVARPDVPTAAPDWTLQDAVAAMQANDLNLLPVTDGEQGFVGIVTLNDAIRLDQILRRARDEVTTDE